MHWESTMIDTNVGDALIATYVGEMAEYMTYFDALALAIERDELAASELKESMNNA